MVSARRLMANSVLSMLAGVVALLAGVASNIVVARLLGPRASGEIAFGLWTSTLVVVCGDFGASAALGQFSAGKTTAELEALRRTMKLLLVRTTVLIILIVQPGIFAYRWLTSHDGLLTSDLAALSVAASAVCLMNGLQSFAYHAMRGVGDFARIARLSAIGAVLQGIAVLAGALAWGPAGALLGYAAAGLPFARQFFALGKGPDRMELTPDLKRFLRHSWVAGVFSPVLWTRMEVPFVFGFAGPVAAGLLNVGSVFSNLLIHSAHVVTAPLVPYLSMGRTTKDAAAAQGDASDALRLFVLLFTPIAFGAAGLAPRLIDMIFGPAFAGTELVSVPMTAAAALVMAYIVATAILQSSGHIAAAARVGVYGAVSVLFNGFVFVPFLEQVGGAVMRVVTLAVISGLALHAVSRRLPMTLPLADLVGTAAAGFAVTSVALLATSFVTGVSGIVLAVCAASLVYALLVRGFGLFGARDFDLALSICERLPRAVAGPASWVLRVLATR